MQSTEEGQEQGQQAKEDYMPPLQEFSLQEASSSGTGQVHVEQKIQGVPLQINLWQAQSGIQTTPQLFCRVSGYASEDNKLGDNWWCEGTLEEGENNNDKWITVTGKGKTKNSLNPKPKPELHNAFAILS
jgi:hypothetical protein